MNYSVKISLFVLIMIMSNVTNAQECVVLLHGLARTSESMRKLETRLTKENYLVANIDYPSRKYPIDELARLSVNQGLEECKKQHTSRINFVTHSLGGILVRVYYEEHKHDDLGRVVMLGPPNHGSEVVDKLMNAPGYELLNGPAGMQLGTFPTDIPQSLGPVDYEVGIIAGTKTINLILSLFLPRPNDGKVSVESAKVDGMEDFITLPVTHPFMMRNDAVIDQTLYFLKHGQFHKVDLTQ